MSNSVLEATAQSRAVAVLFLESHVEVAVERPLGFHVFCVENSPDGLQAFERELEEYQAQAPLFIGMALAPGAQFATPLFSKIRHAPSPKFVMAQTMFLAYAHSHCLSVQRSESLLRAFRHQWPKGSDLVH